MAGIPAYYSPVQITNKSKLFAKSAEYSAPKMQAHQREMRKINKGLIELSLNAELLGKTTPDHWSQEERTQIKRTFYESNYFLDEIQNDYNTVYIDSMNRALLPFQESHTLKECSISRVAQMAGKSAECKGKNLTPQLIEAMDTDSVLIAALEEIEARPWPTLTAPNAQKEIIPITGEKFSVSPSALAKALIPEKLEAVQAEFEDAIAPIEAAIDEGSQEAIKQAEDHRLTYELQLDYFGDQITNALYVALHKAGKKDDKWNDIGFCIQPEVFGGCGTKDVSFEVAELIKNNKKALKSLK